MRLGAFEIDESAPELERPHAFALLRPWVDVGSVGTLSLTAFEASTGAREIGRLYRPGAFFDFTRYRPTIRTVEGRRSITLPNATLYAAKRPDGHDFLFLHLLEPHMNGEAFVRSIIRVLTHFNVERYSLIGSMYDLVPHTRPLLVTGSATGADAEGSLRALDVRSSDYEGPTSIAAMVSQEGIDQGMESLSLIVHLPQYAQLDEDFAGQAKVMEVLSSLYHLELGVADAQRRAQHQSEELDRAVARNPEMRNLLKQLEGQYEQRLKALESGQPEQTELSPNVENFLRELEDQIDS